MRTLAHACARPGNTKDQHVLLLLFFQLPVDVCACFFFCLSPTRTDLPSGETSGGGGCGRPASTQAEDQALCLQQSDGLRVSLLLPPGHNLGQHTQVRAWTQTHGVGIYIHSCHWRHYIIKLDEVSKIKVCRVIIPDDDNFPSLCLSLSAVRRRSTVWATTWPATGGPLLAAPVQILLTRPATSSATTGESGPDGSVDS